MKPQSLSLLRSIWEEGLRAVDPIHLLSPSRSQEALLCWGKAAPRCWEAVGTRSTHGLVIAPTNGSPGKVPPRSDGTRWVFGEHPLPGPGSFRAGTALLEFFDSLRRYEVRHLRVLLSGGASSLAWVRPAEISSVQLDRDLQRLYRAPLAIERLNHERGRLDVLKAGGSARWLKFLAPAVRVRVEVISDVLPYSPSVVGSGPFWDGRVPHRVLADNSTFVEAMARAVRRRGIRVLGHSSGNLGSTRDWAHELGFHSRQKKAGMLIYGGEPQLKLPVRGVGQGGRQSHLAAQLALTLMGDSCPPEILCASSDGKDGNSAGAGVLLDKNFWDQLRRHPQGKSRLRSAIRNFDSARLFQQMGALIPSCPTGTNVQDVVLIHLN